MSPGYLEAGHINTLTILDIMAIVTFFLSIFQPREPFMMLRARNKSDDGHFVQKVDSCVELEPFRNRGTDSIQMLISHGQRAADMAVFLYSVLDVSATHAFFLNTLGDLNLKNFQRFEEKQYTQSITVLNSYVRIVDCAGYEHLRSLILVSCGLKKLNLAGLKSLELLDVRYNELDAIPESIKDCRNLKTLRLSHNRIKYIPREVGESHKKLNVIEATHNEIRRVSSHIVTCTSLKCLELNHNELIELPIDIGLLQELQELIVDTNKLSNLPLSISALTKLRHIAFHHNPLTNIPNDFPERPNEVREYLKSLQEDPVENKMVKLVLVGQEGVGKTTLLKALKRSMWILPRAPSTTKTEGIEIKNIVLDDVTLRCFDCGGDVDFNETHNFFITQGALYLACFNLAEYTNTTVERNSFLLGRLQLWLQYIFSKVPAARVIIVGTHADHSSLKIPIFQQIWEQMRTLLVSARDHHRGYFQKGNRHSDCLLCQSDSKCLRKSTTADGAAGFVNLGYDDTTSLEEETSFNEGPARVVSFPHIVGYYEVSSAKAVGNQNIFQITSNQSIEQLKDAILEVSRKLIKKNPLMPRKWANTQEALISHTQVHPNNCTATLDEVAHIAMTQGVDSRTELENMLHFLKAQGNLLFFPNDRQLQDMVVLDPEWLAKIFSSVVSFRDTGISNEGFIARDSLKAHWVNVGVDMREEVLNLLHYFGVCLSITGTDMELFPCKLPLGEPEDSIWPISPSRGENQVTYSVTFPSLIPPPFFSDLIVTVYRMRVSSRAMDTSCRYFSNVIVDLIELKEIGCRDCGLMGKSTKGSKELIHKVYFELIPHRRTILITARGPHPCCMMKQLNKTMNYAIARYEGLGHVDLDTILCAGCQVQRVKSPHRYSAKLLLLEMGNNNRMTCYKEHTMRNAAAILTGEVNDSCTAYATMKPKSEVDRQDFSGCPRLFIMLPVNKDGLSFDSDLKLFVSSLLFDGYAGHLICEMPDGYHLTHAPGYRIKKPKEFMQIFGTHVVSVLRLLSHMAESSVVSLDYSSRSKAISKTIDDIIKDYRGRFPGFKDIITEVGPEGLIYFINEQGARFRREKLRDHFGLMDRPDTFGPLRRIKYNDQTMWLCQEHYRQFRVLAHGLRGIEGDSNA